MTTPTASIKTNGVDIRPYSANELRASFGVVPRDTILFSGRILANLQAGNPNAPFEQVVEACRMAGIHEVVEALPQGYQTEIGESGVGLSGGQKQRLAIARALLKKPKVLILDEATIALDAETAEGILATVNKLRGKMSIVMVAHGLPASSCIDQTIALKLLPSSAKWGQSFAASDGLH